MKPSTLTGHNTSEYGSVEPHKCSIDMHIELNRCKLIFGFYMNNFSFVTFASMVMIQHFRSFYKIPVGSSFLLTTSILFFFFPYIQAIFYLFIFCCKK